MSNLPLVVIFALCFFSNLKVNFMVLTSDFTSDSILPEKNLIYNGDFELGYNGFESEYDYITDTIYPGKFTITRDIHSWNCFLKNPPGGDHTSGKGNYMVVDSRIFRYSNQSKVWISNAFQVKPKTTYIFSAWVYHVGGPGGSSPELQLTINGKPLSENFRLTSNATKWEHWFVRWNSGKTRGTVNLAIENIYYYQYIEDFAIDDVVFGVAP